MNNVQHRPHYSLISFLFVTMVALIFILGLTSCASLPKKPLPEGTKPDVELSNLESQIDTGYENNYEVLADRDFSKAVKYRDEARDELKHGKSVETVLESISCGEGFIDRARTTADARRDSVEGILLARQAALSAGARHSPLESKLEKVDNRMRSSASDFNSGLSPKDFASLQADYLDVELMAIQNRELAPARALIEDAEKNGAKSNAPKSYSEAIKDVSAAENAIQADRHNSSAYTRSVKRAYLSAKTLSDVTGVINSSGRQTGEDAAIQIVMQRESIKKLQSNLASVENENSTLNDSMTQQKSEVRKLRSRQEFQDAVASVQNEFDKNEAEVLQQGDQVVIRLKKLNFPVGSASIPEKSKPLLTKVSAAVSRLNPSDVIVEGHTDSSGGSQKNLQISQTRAEAVSKYLEESYGVPNSARVEAIGMGYEKPIASNKTKSGRAQNRRVDVIITPDMASF